MCLNIWIDVFFISAGNPTGRYALSKISLHFMSSSRQRQRFFYWNQNSDCRNSLYVNSLIRSFYQRFYHKLDILKINLYFLLQMCTSQSHTQGSIRASSFVENIPCFGSEYLRSIIH